MLSHDKNRHTNCNRHMRVVLHLVHSFKFHLFSTFAFLQRLNENCLNHVKGFYVHAFLMDYWYFFLNIWHFTYVVSLPLSRFISLKLGVEWLKFSHVLKWLKSHDVRVHVFLHSIWSTSHWNTHIAWSGMVIPHQTLWYLNIKSGLLWK